jgi:ribonucleoside-triphosphate reductase (thioredoxin)
MKMELSTRIVDNEFIERMQKINTPVNAISTFTFYRTYSRFDPKLNRRENFLEACVRSGEYSVGLAIKQLKKSKAWIEKVHRPLMKKEAEELIEHMYSLKAFVSGRTLYTGGSTAAELYPLSNFNCSSAVMDEYKKIGELFYLLMVGTGFGFRILKEDVEKLPTIRQDVEIEHKEYEEKLRWMRLENTKLILLNNNGLNIDELDENEDTVPVEAVMEIGDSKEGWRQSIDTFFSVLTSSLYSNIKKLTIVYDSVRPKGERLRTFGGTASGHTSIRNMFTTIDKIIKNQLDERLAPIENGKLRPIHVMDICNAVAYNVVSGGKLIA